MFFWQGPGRLTLHSGFAADNLVIKTWFVWDELTSTFGAEAAGVAQVARLYANKLVLPKAWLPGC